MGVCGAKAFAGIVKATFDGPQGDLQLPCDLLLGKFLPVAHAEDLLILGRKFLQRIQHQVVTDTGEPGGHDSDAIRMDQWNLAAPVLMAEEIGAFVPGDANQPWFEASRLVESSKTSNSCRQHFLQDVLCISRIVDVKVHIPLDCRAMLRPKRLKGFHAFTSFAE